MVPGLIERGTLDLAVIDNWDSYFTHAILVLFALSFRREYFFKYFIFSPTMSFLSYFIIHMPKTKDSDLGTKICF